MARMAKSLALALIVLSVLLAQCALATPARGDLSPNEARAIVGAALGRIRARANPTGSYTPSQAACPASFSGGQYTGYLRSSATSQGGSDVGALSPNETEYIQRHQQATQQSWTQWLSSAAPGPSIDIAGGVQNYTSDVGRLPRVGIALSGGGYRAMLHGAGVLQGLDARNTTAQRQGTAGFLQQALYVAGLSGGSWALGSLALNDWPQAQTLVEQVWNLEENLVIPEDNAISFYADIVADVAGKRHADYPTGITDYWGRALSYHLVNSSYPSEGQGTTFGDIRNTSSFQQATYPFPIVIADEREPGELLIYRNTTIFEFNPFEFGSFDPTVQAFVPIDILGTSLANGASAEENGQCTYGFDNFGWVVGTSSTLFNGAFNALIQSDGDSLIKDALTAILGAISNDENDVSVVPNPFRGYNQNGGQNSVAGFTNITLVDGGEDNQNIPVNTLLLPQRELDLIVAVDSSADVTDWPNGTALHETFLRYSTQAQFSSIPVPVIPAPTTFVNRGLNTRPTFFGCNVTQDNTVNFNETGAPPPIIAYLPNYPYASLSNTSTFLLQYNDSLAQAVLDNAVEVATLGGSQIGSLQWSTCLACASLERGFARSNTARPQACTQCLQTFCWDGVVNDTMPGLAYSPPVGAPLFVSSQGAQQVIAPYTGGNGSNADSDERSGSSDAAKSSASSQHTVHGAAVACAVLAILAASMAV